MELFCDSAFESLNQTLITAPIMQAPDWERPFRCHVDACQEAVWGTLTQMTQKGGEHVIAYFFLSNLRLQKKITAQSSVKS